MEATPNKIILKAKSHSSMASVGHKKASGSSLIDERTSLKVHLYKTYFTLSSTDRPIPYQGPLSSFISSLNTLSIGPNLIATLPAKYFENGRLQVECIDHRYGITLDPIHLYLHPSPEAIYNDIQAFGQDHFGTEWNEAEMGIELERKALKQYFPTLDLHVHKDSGLQQVPPSSHIQHTLENYNRNKYIYPIKRTFDTAHKDDHEDFKRIQQTKRVLAEEDENQDTEFYPRFSQLNFIEDWRRKEKQADEEALIGLGDKTRIKLTSSGIAAPRKMLAYNQNRKIVRTVRFESVVNKVHKYSIFNAYDIGDGQYEGVLRWGSQEGTSIGGSTLRYPLGNKNAVDYYVAHFRGFYGILHKLVADSNDPANPVGK